MKIETQFNIGDNVFYLYNNKVVFRSIDSISIYSSSYDGKNEPTIKYGFVTGNGSSYEMFEKEVFSTKENLLKSL